MTDEPEGATESFISSKKVQYAYAYEDGSLSRYFRIKGVPHAILVDASGKVVWRGHPMQLSDSVIEKSLDKTLLKPVWEGSASVKGVHAALAKRDYAGALAAAEKVGEAEQGALVIESLKGLIARRIEVMNQAFEQGNFLDAESGAALLSKGLGNLPERAVADKVAADIKADKLAARVIKAQKDVRAIQSSSPSKSKEIDKAIADLKKIAKDLPDSYAAKEANALIEALQDAKRNK